MNRESIIRAVAGIFITASVLLGNFVHPNWFFFTGFVGLNLLQSSFTKACPLDWMLKKAGVKSAGACAC